MARSMLSDGMFAPRHLSSAMRNRGFMSGSPPPTLAATVISRDSLAKMRARLASMAPLKCMTFAHLLCPAIPNSSFSPRGLDKHRGAIAQHLGDARANLGRVIAHADDRVSAQRPRVRQHVPERVVPRPLAQRGVKRNIAAEQALNARADVSDNRP